MAFIIQIWHSNPPARKASREVANLTERKNPPTPVYGVKEFVRLSVCLWSTLTPIISGLAKQNGLKKCRLGKVGKVGNSKTKTT